MRLVKTDLQVLHVTAWRIEPDRVLNFALAVLGCPRSIRGIVVDFLLDALDRTDWEIVDRAELRRLRALDNTGGNDARQN